MRKKIRVYPRHIKLGVKSSVCSCPVAKAIIQKLKVDPSLVHVCEEGIRIGDETYKTPRQVFRFITKFDNQKPVKPFSFFLEKINAN